MIENKLKLFFVSESYIKKLRQDINVKSIKQLANINRIHCLAGLKSANHGWLGANFSAMEILTSIYELYVKSPTLPISERPVTILSKGHAVMAMYSILQTFGCYKSTDIESYKNLNGLPAHCDSRNVGIDADSGSLGQGLSKAIGIAKVNEIYGRSYPVFVLIGDGELQEGQLFEAFLTLKKLNLSNCIPIIDRNHLQSDSQTKDIKDAKDWQKVFAGIGLEVNSMNGHNIHDIARVLEHRVNSDIPGVVIAETIKGYGSEITSMSKDIARRKAIWHGKIPDDNDYINIVQELVDGLNDTSITEQFIKYRAEYFDSYVSGQTKLKIGNNDNDNLSTAKGFANALVDIADIHKNIYFLDADLEKSCNLTDLASKHTERFIEVGISEQDMCSIANGIALNGGIAVVNTYASFYKRAVDQIFACATEKVPVVFAGHYAGIDYFSDGKSHQSVNDIGIFRAIGGIDIFEPLTASHSRCILRGVIERMQQEIEIGEKSRPTYIRLHRTPNYIEQLSSEQENDFEPIVELKSKGNAEYVIFTSGPHMLETSLAIQSSLSEQDIYVDVVAVVEISRKIKFPFNQYKKVFCIEDNLRNSGLGAAISLQAEQKIVRIGVSDFYQSTRNFEDMKKQHDLDIDTISKIILKAMTCQSH